MKHPVIGIIILILGIFSILFGLFSIHQAGSLSLLFEWASLGLAGFKFMLRPGIMDKNAS